MKKKSGFTLAEVLITLSIIGIVAAMTIPAMQKNLDNAQHRVALKKTYSVISNAANLIKQENGGTLKGLCADADAECIRNKFAEKINTTKTCAQATDENCWANAWYDYDGDLRDSINNIVYKAFVSNDGNFYTFRWTREACNDWFGRCGFIIIDTNGNKKPNKIGYDIHWFHILPDKIDPMGGINEGYECSDEGYGCTAKMLLGNM